MASTSAPTAPPPTATATTAGPTTGSPPEATPPKTIVIKLGTSSILSEHTHQPKLSILSSLVETCHALRTAGHRVVLVCSGAIGMGRVRMGMMAPSGAAAAAGSSASKAPELGERQALAALGQLRLIALWDSLFGQLGISVAQVLLTRNDIADRPRYLNARTTLHTLLSPRFDAIPIVNENDTVSVSELRFGDNDTLSAITAGLVEADYLFLLTDVDGLYTGNPRREPGARRLGVVRSVAEARRAVEVQTMGSRFGTGGMQTKLIAADLATAAGVATVIINGSHPENIIRVVAAASLPSPATSQGQSMNKGKESETGAAHEDLASSTSSLQISKDDIGHPALEDPPHTLFLPTPEPLTARKWSILHALHPAGTLIIDEGAYSRIRTRDSGGRLLPAGVVGVEGTWERMQALRIVVRRRRRPRQASATGSDEEQQHQLAAAGAVVMPPLKALGSYLRRNDSPSGTVTPPVIDGLRRPHRPLSAAAAAAADTDAGHDSEPRGRRAEQHGEGEQESTHEEQQEEAWELVEVARGLANYNSIESERIKGIKRLV